MTTAQRTHRRIAGACMVLAPLSLLVSAILQPQLKSDEVGQLTVVSANLDRWFASQAFALVAIALMVPAVLGLMHMLRERKWVWGTVGGGLALLGLLAATGAVAINLVAWEMMRFGIPIPATAAVLHDAKHVTGLQIPFIVLPFALSAGFLALSFGLGVSRAVSPVMAVLIALGGLLMPIGIAVASVTLVVIAAAALLVGLGATGVVVLREPDADWEHTPRFHGFRAAGPPAAGA